MLNSSDFSEFYVKTHIKISFTMEDNKNPSLKELGNFLMAISKIHEFSVLSSQPEYNLNSTQKQRRINVFPYHELEIITFCRKNPFDVELCFYTLKEGLVSYLTFLKVLLFICKRYCKNSGQFSISANELRILINKICVSLNSNYLISKYLELLSNNEELEAYLASLNFKLNNILLRPYMKRNFEQFCRTSFLITSMVAYISDTNETYDFLQD